jgi:hypothetical protein
MSSATDFLEDALLELILNNNATGFIGDAGGLLPSAGDGNLYVSLHTANPGEAGAQTDSECAFGAYARQAVSRVGTAWLVASGVATNVNDIEFPECTSGSEIITHVGIGTVLSGGAGKLIFVHEAANPLPVATGGIPKLIAGALTITAS